MASREEFIDSTRQKVRFFFKFQIENLSFWQASKLPKGDEIGKLLSKALDVLALMKRIDVPEVLLDFSFFRKCLKLRLVFSI